jgi:molybdopterin-containing oxidoreductase family iron-sulfur binding subunit
MTNDSRGDREPGGLSRTGTSSGGAELPRTAAAPADARRGPAWWRTLEELADEPSFRERLYNEFPSQIEAIQDPVARRTFLKLMGASLALGGVTACTRQPTERIVPYVRQPEELVPGRPLFYATAMTLGGVATGLLVESHEGRPTKIEGNPLHPGSVGAGDVFAQASVLGLYDPDRSRTLTNLGDIRPWAAFLGTIRVALTAQQPTRGAGLRLLTEAVSSPTLAQQIRDLLARFPSAKWHQWDPASPDNARAGAKLAFGDYAAPQYHFDRADIVVSLDADFLACGGGALRYARDFAARRRPDRPDAMNRLYAFESMPTPTGARADHRFPLTPHEIARAAHELAAAVGVTPAGTVPSPPSKPEIQKAIAAIATDLQRHRGAGLVIAGDEQAPSIHALAHAMNGVLGNAGSTVTYTDPPESAPLDQVQSLRDLVDDMKAGTVDLLVIVGGNPVYTAPVDLGFAEAMAKVHTRVHLSLYDDETSALCHWHIPEAHFLETWSDARGHDGTVSIVQPLIAPLYGGRTAHELLAAMSDRPERSGYDVVREYWQREGRGGQRSAPAAASPAPAGASRAPVAASRAPSGAQSAAAAASAPAAARLAPAGTPPGPPAVSPAAAASGPPADPAFEQEWRRWLHDGVIPGTAFQAKSVAIRTADVSRLSLEALSGAGNGIEVRFRIDPCVLDGRFANNGWLQELPKPISKLTWDNAVFASPATAERLRAVDAPSWEGGEHGQIISTIVEVRYRGRAVRGGVFPIPGHPDNCVTLHLGYGRTRAGNVGNGTGFNANAIRTSDALWGSGGGELIATGDTMSLACTQSHHLMEGRGMVRAVTREEFVNRPDSVHEGFEEPPRTLTLYPEFPYEGYKWGMAIDVNACIGCNACVVACQSENNIAIVGKDQVLRGREMHWLRVDAYYRGPAGNPETYFQPVPCMHCENAPCEPVCPVGATVHSHEGLNDMVYNRCVGTRYCSNNCPYKVRRFNYLLYQDWNTPSLKLLRNPDVSVRSRGVMEKCTYCVQRINEVKIDAEKADRRVGDGDIKTACQQTCPADAIVFGDLNDPKSRVAQLQAEARSYSLLGELNTRPRTKYLAAVRNPNPELGG